MPPLPASGRKPAPAKIQGGRRALPLAGKNRPRTARHRTGSPLPCRHRKSPAEMIEEAIQSDQAPDDLINVLQQLPKNSVEHLADRFFRARRRVRMRSHCRSRRRTRTTRHRRSALHPGHRTTPPGGFYRRPVEPSCRELAAGVFARAHRRLQPFLSGRHRPSDRLWRSPDRGRTLVELLELLDAHILPKPSTRSA